MKHKRPADHRHKIDSLTGKWFLYAIKSAVKSAVGALQGFILTLLCLLLCGLFLSGFAKGSLQEPLAASFSTTVSQLNRLNASR